MPVYLIAMTLRTANRLFEHELKKICEELELAVHALEGIPVEEIIKVAGREIRTNPPQPNKK